MARAAGSPLERICGRHRLPHSKSSAPGPVTGFCHAAFAPTWRDSWTQMCCYPLVGYQPHEPHGSSPVTTQTVVWSWRPRGLGRGCSRHGRCGFRLWRTPPGHGKPDTGVCVVLSCKGNRSQPDGAAGGMRPGEGDVTGAIAPTKPLTALDLCDRCGAQAYVRVLLPNSGELLFCAHHGREHAQALAKVAVDIQDETQRLAKPEN